MITLFDYYNQKPTRTKWSAYFGCSLTAKIAEYYAKGKTANECYAELSHALTIIANDEILHKKLKKSVISRYSEMKTEQKIIKKHEKR